MNYVNYNFDFRRNRIIEPSQMLTASNIFTPTSDQKVMLGCILDLNDGRRFRYCENAANTLYKALMLQSSAPVANWTEIANASGAAGTAGDMTIQITLSTTCAANDFRDGWLCVTDATTDALGDLYLIKSNTSGTTPTLTLADDGGLRTATTTSTEFTVIKNKYKDVVAVPAAAATSVAVGVPMTDVTASYYFWAQTRGVAALIIDTDDVVQGNPVGETATANVAGGGGVVATDCTGPVWGIVLAENTSGETDQPCIVDLMLE